MIIRSILILLAAVSGASGALVAHAADPGGEPVIMRGQLPEFSYPDLQQNVDMTWKFAQSNGGAAGPLVPPVIYVSEFKFEIEEPAWRVWQKDWIAHHPEIWEDWKRNNPGQAVPLDGDPFPSNFYAFHYDGTNRIQANAEMAFLRFYQIDPYGERKDYTGFGYYTIGHELHHYVLESRGVPDKLHHCLFLRQRAGDRKPLMDALADFLVSGNISSSYIYANGLQMEYALDPCGQLSREELRQVEEWKAKL